MSVLTDPATYILLKSELTNCSRTVAVQGELAAQWQQLMGTLQRVEQETVSSQNLANAVENLSRKPTAIEGWRTTLPEELVRQHPLGLAREVAAWLGYVDPKYEAGKLIQRITKGTIRATEAFNDGRYPEDDKHVEQDYELAVTLANVTEGPARATVLKVPQTEPSHGFVAWQALVDGYAPKSSNVLAMATTHTCDAQEVHRCKGKCSQHGH